MAVLKLHLKSMELICREKRQSYMKEIKIDGKSIAEHKIRRQKNKVFISRRLVQKLWIKKSKTQEGDAREKQTIIDQVSYENLLPGETYILKGVLMDKADGKEMTDKNNRKITGRTTFTPEKSAGTVEDIRT